MRTKKRKRQRDLAKQTRSLWRDNPRFTGTTQTLAELYGHPCREGELEWDRPEVKTVLSRTFRRLDYPLTWTYFSKITVADLLATPFLGPHKLQFILDWYQSATN